MPHLLFRQMANTADGAKWLELISKAAAASVAAFFLWVGLQIRSNSVCKMSNVQGLLQTDYLTLFVNDPWSRPLSDIY